MFHVSPIRDCLLCRLLVVACQPMGCNTLYGLSDVAAHIFFSSRELFLSQRKGGSRNSPILIHGIRKYVAHFHEVLREIHVVFSFVLRILLRISSDRCVVAEFGFQELRSMVIVSCLAFFGRVWVSWLMWSGFLAVH